MKWLGYHNYALVLLWGAWREMWFNRGIYTHHNHWEQQMLSVLGIWNSRGMDPSHETLLCPRILTWDASCAEFVLLTSDCFHIIQVPWVYFQHNFAWCCNMINARWWKRCGSHKYQRFKQSSTSLCIKHFRCFHFNDEFLSIMKR